jgi:SOS response regulatory protein OraA/RecX
MTENPMTNLIEYIKKNLKKGYDQDTLKFALISQGYSKVAVEQALTRATQERAEKAPILKAKPVIKYEIIDENDRPIKLKKSFLKRLFEI